jgi:uroporphyrinogen decarboxylase
MNYGDGPNPHRVEPLVKKMSDLEALQYLYPEPRKDLFADIPILLEDIGERAVTFAFDTTSFGCWGMEVLGPENTLISSQTEPDLLKAVCRLANDAHLKNLRAILEQGFEVVYDSWFQCGPSVGWSPDTYQNVFLPLITEVINLAHEFDAIYIYQDDGKMKDIILCLVEAGVDCISGLQPPEVGDVVLEEVKKKYGNKVALYGGLDSCHAFDMGNPDVVREAVRQAIVDAGEMGGYIIGTGEAVDPTLTTPECLRASADAAKEFGVYK